ncbi:putative rho-like GTP binding protein [Trypanosoma cruzi]|nr:putative rho-like GTP binding protein [Trypanosoma cruzi]
MEETLHCKVILLGDGKVGKTCLQYSFANGLEYLAGYREYQKTAIENYELLLPINDSNEGVGGSRIVRLGLWDTAGQEEFDELRRMCYTSTVAPVAQAGDGNASGAAGNPKPPSSPSPCDVSVFILCFAWDDPHSLTNVQMRWYREIRRVEQDLAFLGNGSHYRPFNVLLCGTKFDLRVDADQRGITEGMVTREQAYTVQKSIKADALVTCSSKTGFGVRDVFHTAMLLWLQRQPQYARELTPNFLEALPIDGDCDNDNGVVDTPNKQSIERQSCQLF